MSKIKLVSFETIEKNWMKNDQVRKAFQNLEPEYQLAQEIYEGIKSIQGRTLDSYSELEKEGLRGYIQSVRGF